MLGVLCFLSWFLIHKALWGLGALFLGSHCGLDRLSFHEGSQISHSGLEAQLLLCIEA